MTRWRIGDMVARKSHNSDIYFKIIGFTEDNKVLLKGLDVRLLADAPADDLVKLSIADVQQYEERLEKENNRFMTRTLKRQMLEKEKNGQRSLRKDSFFEVSGTVLHLDGDPSYLQKCLSNYERLNIAADGEYVPEQEQPARVLELLPKYRPSILVLTGHDALIKNKGDQKDLNNYRNSKYFVEAVKNAREYSPYLDDLVIFAGACQSHYEALLEAGANFASSPQRVFINIYDPVYIVEKIAQTSIQKFIHPSDVIATTTTGVAGIGGVETRGKLRIGMPKPM